MKNGKLFSGGFPAWMLCAVFAAILVYWLLPHLSRGIQLFEEQKMQKDEIESNQANVKILEDVPVPVGARKAADATRKPGSSEE